jgi:hypothetical protein
MSRLGGCYQTSKARQLDVFWFAVFAFVHDCYNRFHETH